MCSQSDVLLGLLETFADNTSATETFTEKSHLRAPSVVSKTLVGPTAAELESINELIHFDHIYVKSESTEDSKAPLVSVLKPLRSKFVSPSSLSKDTGVLVSKSAVPEAPLNLNLGDVDLGALTDSLNDMVDFDTMLKTLSPNATLAQPPEVCMNKKRKNTAEDDNANAHVKKCRISDKGKVSLIANMSTGNEYGSILVTPDSHDMAYPFGFDDNLQASAESGYVSDIACSPKSEVSDTSETSYAWEESFTELFPTLL